MLKKKSYMDINNLLSEGFFDKIKSYLKDKKKLNLLKKDKKFMSHLDKLNQNVDDIEKYFKDKNINVNLNKFTSKDFRK
tara:strand:+ start:166 stop:402 length:237 start_codon:yes stop_codon:yes gene_type:complete